MYTTAVSRLTCNRAEAGHRTASMQVTSHPHLRATSPYRTRLGAARDDQEMRRSMSTRQKSWRWSHRRSLRPGRMKCFPLPARRRRVREPTVHGVVGHRYTVLSRDGKCGLLFGSRIRRGILRVKKIICGYGAAHAHETHRSKRFF
jgi:hypothetical protein